MQRGRGGRDDFYGGFGDLFAGFPGFGGRPQSLISNFFGGRDPFDDPFFTQPFGSMMGPSMMGPSMFGPSIFGSRGSIFEETNNNAGFLEQQAPAPPARSKGPIIKEISSDDDEEDENGGKKTVNEKKENPRKHSRSSKEPYVQDPDEEVEEKKSRSVQHRSEFDRTGAMRPQAQTYSFQSSSVTYGGHSGPYYTASTTRRMGGDGVVMEESKEADSTTGKAAHRVSRGIHDKGHTLMRKLNSDGRVDSLQTLHNLHEDELVGFDETWKGKARQHLPGWNQGYDMLDNSNTSVRTGGRHGDQLQSGWALPSTGQPNTTSGGGNSQSRSNSFGGRGRGR
ncbi:uncharacterized protein A4U43_C01F18140 [Asparagus officinalis]|uniref:Glycine-rich protein n=1 Tax=Asparagus officinalis TaxID=4686 RepID=A0A5P1FQI6_ASPOF|nr:uncharacterized protein LOC109825167 isoform X2 [Asparagus officinalis]ONK80478.1 uncharacterized protein A4U43_C01F18140 [Asparagus officinalis]